MIVVFQISLNYAPKSSHCEDMIQEIFLTAIFLSFAFFSIKTTSNNITSTPSESWEIGPQILYHGEIGPGASPIRVNDTDRLHVITNTLQKSVYILYLCLQLFVPMYLLPDSSSISISVCNPVEFTGIQSHSTGLHWIPLDSARITGVWQEWGGNVKYCENEEKEEQKNRHGIDSCWQC